MLIFIQQIAQHWSPASLLKYLPSNSRKATEGFAMLYIHPCLQVRLENNHLFRGKLKRTDLRPSIIKHLKVVADLKNLYVSPITGNCEHLYDQPTSPDFCYSGAATVSSTRKLKRFSVEARTSLKLQVEPGWSLIRREPVLRLGLLYKLLILNSHKCISRRTMARASLRHRRCRSPRRRSRRGRSTRRWAGG